MFITRSYNEIKFNSADQSITKYSKDDKLINETQFYLNLPGYLKHYFPKLINHRTGLTNELTLEYYAYPNLGDYLRHPTIYTNINFWESVFTRLFDFIQSPFNDILNLTDKKDDCIKMYIDKTEKEYNKLLSDNSYFHNLKNTTIYLNKTELLPFSLVWTNIKKYILNNCLTTDFNIIHGDFCFSNILCGYHNGNIVLKFVDPRGSFGNNMYIGDRYYDLAKLYHSVNGGYEFIINHDYELREEDNHKFYFQFYRNNIKDEVKTVFINMCSKYNFNLNKIKILEGLCYISMIARHSESLENQKVMYLTGLKILNEINKELYESTILF